MLYTPDKVFKKKGGYYGDERYVKSYSFHVKARFPVEEQITLVIWVIDDLGKAKTFLGVEGVNNLSGSQRQQDGSRIPYKLDGNKSITVSFFNLPKSNPKNETPLTDNSFQDFIVNKGPDDPNMNFEPLSYYALQDRYDKGEEKVGTKPTSLDSYIDYTLSTAEFIYKNAIYQIRLSSEADLPNFKLAENEVKFTQSPTGEGQTPEGQTPNSGTQSVTESKPIANGTYTFGVQKKGFFVISGQPELKLATEEDLKRLQNQGLDEEYIESGYQGDDESTIGINPESTIEMRTEKDKELEEQYKKEQSGVSQQTDTGTGNNVQLSGGGSMKGGVKVSYTKKTPSWGKVTKGLTDAQLLKAMVDYIEGGYYYPGHAYSQFNERSRNLYGNSGETLWGIDRCAGQTENTELGKKFWTAFDKVSGHGDSTGTLAPLVPNKQTKKAEPVTYAQSTRTKEWDPNKYPAKAIALKYGKSPLPSTPGYDIMYNAFVDLAIGNLKSLSEKNFKGHPLRDLIFSDARLKFCWLRSTWNGSGWFSRFSTNLKKVYDSGVKDVDSLIIADLNHRLTYNIGLITHDVVKISQLLGIEPSSNVA